MKTCPRCGAPQADGLPTCDVCGSLFPGEKKPKKKIHINFAGIFGLVCALLAIVSNVLIFSLVAKYEDTEDPYEIIAVFIIVLLAIAGAVTLPFAGMILSIIGVKKSKTFNMGGKGFGIAGIILSSIMVLVSLLYIFFIIMFFFYELGGG